MALSQITWMQLLYFYLDELPENAFENLPEPVEYNFIDQADPDDQDSDDYIPENHLIVGRICLDDRDTFHYRHLLAYVHPDTVTVTLGFYYRGEVFNLSTWDHISFELEFCAPFNLIDMTDDLREVRLSLFVRYCFLLTANIDHLMIGDDFLLDLGNILIDVAWGWRMWGQHGETPEEFAKDTIAMEGEIREIECLEY